MCFWQFGGFWHAIGTNPYTQCSSASDNCVWYNDLWYWIPTAVPKVRSMKACALP